MNSAKRYWLLRAYVAGHALFLALLTLLSPEALSKPSIGPSDPLGWVAVSALSVAALIAIFDVIVNDLLPSRFSLPSFLRHRHFVYMGLALGVFSMSAVLLRTGGWTPIMLLYWWDVLFATAVAIVDVLARHHPDRRGTDRRSEEQRKINRRSLA